MIPPLGNLIVPAGLVFLQRSLNKSIDLTNIYKKTPSIINDDMFDQFLDLASSNTYMEHTGSKKKKSRKFLKNKIKHNKTKSNKTKSNKTKGNKIKLNKTKPIHFIIYVLVLQAIIKF
jgi:hypothetical protein